MVDENCDQNTRKVWKLGQRVKTLVLAASVLVALRYVVELIWQFFVVQFYNNLIIWEPLFRTLEQAFFNGLILFGLWVALDLGIFLRSQDWSQPQPVLNTSARHNESHSIPDTLESMNWKYPGWLVPLMLKLLAIICVLLFLINMPVQIMLLGFSDFGVSDADSALERWLALLNFVWNMAYIYGDAALRLAVAATIWLFAVVIDRANRLAWLNGSKEERAAMFERRMNLSSGFKDLPTKITGYIKWLRQVS